MSDLKSEYPNFILLYFVLTLQCNKKLLKFVNKFVGTHLGVLKVVLVRRISYSELYNLNLNGSLKEVNWSKYNFAWKCLLCNYFGRRGRANDFTQVTIYEY